MDHFKQFQKSGESLSEGRIQRKMYCDVTDVGIDKEIYKDWREEK